MAILEGARGGVRGPFSARDLLVFAVVFCIGAAVAFGFWGFSYDDAFITYRYAQNWVEQGEFTYNPGETVFGTTAPGYALLLGLLTFTTQGIGIGIPEWGTLLSVISLCGVTLVFGFYAREWDPLYAFGVPIFFGSVALTTQWNVELLGAETLPVLALATVSSYLLFEKRRDLAAGIILSLAVILRLDAGLAGIAFVLIYCLKHRKLPWGFTLVFLVTAGFWLLFLTALYGQPVPHTLDVKRADYIPRILGYIRTEWRWLVRTMPVLGRVTLLAFAACGLSVLLGRQRIRQPMILALGLWVLGCEIAYRLMHVAFSPWYHVQTINATIALAVIGALECSLFLLRRTEFLGRRASRLILPLVLTGCLLSPLWLSSVSYVVKQWRQPPDPRFRIYSQVGEYIAQTAEPNDCVAAVEIGVLGYTARRPILDLVGLVSPEVLEARASGQLPEYVIMAAPEYIVDNTGFHEEYLAPILDQPEIRDSYRSVREFRTPEYEGRTVRLLERLD